MSATQVPIRRVGGRRGAPFDFSSWSAVAAAAVAAALAALVITSSAPAIRLVVALVVLGNLLLLVVRAPRAAVVSTMGWLLVMGLVRKLLISSAGWPNTDPLLLVGPIVAAALVLQLYLVERRPVEDLPGLLAVALLLVAVLDVVNPSGGGLVVGVGGLLFMGTPLVWFLIGRVVMDRRAVEQVMLLLVGLGTLIAAYGLAQSVVGFPSWDRAWLRVAGFLSLQIGDVTRPVGPFTSASEYLIVVGSACAAALALSLDRWPMLALLCPGLLAVLFYGSGRSTFVYTAFACITVLVLHVMRGRAALISLVAALGLTVATLVIVAPALRAQQSSSNSLIAHQTSGLSDPLNEGSSTLPAHIRAFRYGVQTGVSHPLGLGTGQANISGQKLGSSNTGNVSVLHDGAVEEMQGTDIDVSNTFLGLGVIGGLLYLGLIFAVATQVARRLRQRRDPLLLAVIGIAIVATGQWLTGGHYAASSILWVTAGWATRRA